MGRLACVDIPALALQVLLKAHPEWQGEPVVLLDRPQASGVVQAVNAAAQKGGVQPGLRYAVALNRLPNLRGGTVDASTLKEAQAALLGYLQGFSPEVEPAESGVFWLDVVGLAGLYPSLDVWAQALRAALKAEAYVVGVVVGFSRTGTRSVARVLNGRKHLVFEGVEAEREVVARVPLNVLGWPAGVVAALGQLGVTRVGAFLRLPAAGIASRFGEEAWKAYQELRGDRFWPLQPAKLALPHALTVNWDHGETCRVRMLFQLKGPVTQLLQECASKGQGATALSVDFWDESGDGRCLALRLAEPTVAGLVVLNLLQLRLESFDFGDRAVVGARVAMVGVPVRVHQETWLLAAPKRDKRLANRAFERLRALFGDEDVVVKAVLCDRHLPEERFDWQPLTQLSDAAPKEPEGGTLVRQLWQPPREITPRPTTGDWYPLGWAAGAVVGWEGPYRLAGGWWQDATVRDYHRLELSQGALLWVFNVPEQGRWFLQGAVC